MLIQDLIYTYVVCNIAILLLSSIVGPADQKLDVVGILLVGLPQLVIAGVGKLLSRLLGGTRG